jgi:predicted ester cyclase
MQGGGEVERHLPRHLSCWTVRGTHQGEVEEFGPSTGRQVEIKGITIHRIEDGKIVEEWEGYDNLSILQQLGLAPEQ